MTHPSAIRNRVRRNDADERWACRRQQMTQPSTAMLGVKRSAEMAAVFMIGDGLL